GDAFVAWLFEQVDEAYAVVAQQHRVGVESEHVLGVGDGEICGLTVCGGEQGDAVARLNPLPPLAHEREVRVQVHRFVRLLRERLICLALEGVGANREDAHEPVVELSHALCLEGVTLVGRRFESQQRSEEHTSEFQSRENLVCRLLLEKKNQSTKPPDSCKGFAVKQSC